MDIPPRSSAWHVPLDNGYESDTERDPWYRAEYLEKYLPQEFVQINDALIYEDQSRLLHEHFKTLSDTDLRTLITSEDFARFSLRYIRYSYYIKFLFPWLMQRFPNDYYVKFELLTSLVEVMEPAGLRAMDNAIKIIHTHLLSAPRESWNWMGC